MFIAMKAWPKVSRVAEDIKKYYGKSPLGLDLEWNPETQEITILGLSDGSTAVSVPWVEGKPYLIELLDLHPSTVFVEHNGAGADTIELAAEGITIPLENVEDTIIRHWLTNMHLCKTTQKSALEDGEGEKKGRGFMNLGTMCSLYTSLPYWKECREQMCEGPCKVHDIHGYNGIDAMGPVLALPSLRTTMKLRGVEKLYPMHRELSYVLAEMEKHGVAVDVPYVHTLRDKFEEDKEEKRKELLALGFNPDSHKQVLEYFASQAESIKLENNQEQTIRDMVEEMELEEVYDHPLVILLDYKELGNGPDRWFGPNFLKEDGRIHPHLGFYTSSGRMMCAGPNLQNVAKRRIDRKTGENIGGRIRRAITAGEGNYIVRADYSNAENRVYLKLAGYEPPNFDLHNWMVKNIGIKETDEFAIASGGARNASKSVTHAADYFEGLMLLEPSALRKPKIRKEIEYGARLVFPEWKFNGKVVTITGINMARRAFKEATYENRKRALEITERYIGKDGAYPNVRELQKRIMRQIEEERVVCPPHGYVLLSYGRDEDRIKQALAVWGSQPVAHISKLALLDIDRKRKAGRPMRQFLQVHDELLTEVPLEVPPCEAMGWLKGSMEIETPEMPGFVIPAEGSFGPNWNDQTKEWNEEKKKGHKCA